MSAIPPRDFLRSPVADAASFLLFALAGRLAADVVPTGGVAAVREALALACTCMGPLGVAIERGASRPVSTRAALLFGLGAALAHVVARLAPAAVWLGAWPTPAGLGLVDLGAVLVAFAAGAAISRLGPRLDRGEEGWRAVLREEPPRGASPLAWRIAATRLPRPLRLLLLPIDLPVRAAGLLAIRLYQLTASRLMPPACRFEPTCSRYGWTALCEHGAVRGTLLTGLRLLRCSPISDGGHDPVPPADLQLPEVPERREVVEDARQAASAAAGGRTGEVSSAAVEEPPPR